jgi:hypothetical protein
MMTYTYLILMMMFYINIFPVIYTMSIPYNTAVKEYIGINLRLFVFTFILFGLS